MSAPNPKERPSVWEVARTALLCTNLVWTTLCLGGVLPTARIVTMLLTAALVVAHLCDPGVSGRAHPAGWLFLPFLGYAAANVAWVTPFPWIGWRDWLNWAQAVAVFWVTLNGITSACCRRALGTTLLGLGVVATALAVYQHFFAPSWLMLGRTQLEQFLGRSTGCFGIPNSLGAFLALLIPPTGALAFDKACGRARRIGFGLLLGVLLLGFVLAVSRGAWIALAAAFVLRVLLGPGESPLRRVAGAFLALLTVAAFATVIYTAFPLMRTRVHLLAADSGEPTRPILWRAAWKIFEQHPILGGGAGSFDFLFEAQRPVGFRDEPVYAHCDYLNTLSDYGAAGFILFFGAVGTLAWRCAGARGLAGAALTGLLAFFLHLAVDFHLKIPALALGVAAIGAWVTAELWPCVSSPFPGKGARWVGRVLASAALVLATGFALPRLRAERYRWEARQQIDTMAAKGVDPSRERLALDGIRNGLDTALNLDPSNAQAWADKAYADSLWSLVNPKETRSLGKDVERESARALALSPAMGEFWIRMGTGLDMQGRWYEGGDCFLRALQLEPNRADAWYYQAYHLSLKASEAGPALGAVDVCLRLDPGFLLAQLLRQRLGAR